MPGWYVPDMRHLPPPPPRARSRVAPAGQAGSTDYSNLAVATFWVIAAGAVGIIWLDSKLSKQQESKRRQMGCWPKYGNRDCLGIL